MLTRTLALELAPHKININSVAPGNTETPMNESIRTDSAYAESLAYMEQVAQTYDFNDHALLRFQQSIKDVLDPAGVIAPGKSGIWPKSYR